MRVPPSHPQCRRTRGRASWKPPWCVAYGAYSKNGGDAVELPRCRLSSSRSSDPTDAAVQIVFRPRFAAFLGRLSASKGVSHLGSDTVLFSYEPTEWRENGVQLHPRRRRRRRILKISWSLFDPPLSSLPSIPPLHISDLPSMATRVPLSGRIYTQGF